MCSQCDQCPACGRNNGPDLAELERGVALLREALEAMFVMTGAANGSPPGDEPAEAQARWALKWKPK